MSGAVKVVSGVLTLMLILMGAMGGLAAFLYHVYERPGPLEVSRVVTIPKGEGRIAIAERLEREGIIQSRWVFVASHLLQSWYGAKRGLDLKAGEYEIKKNASMAEVLAVLSEGKSVLYKLAIPEGLTSQQIVERIGAEPSLTGTVTAVPPEGSLLPDTYRFSKGMDRGELLQRMQVEQQRLLESSWEQRREGLPIKTKEEALVLASIVEKETGRPDERNRVAAVFANRLKKGMRLQSDPTIIYGVVGGQGTLGRPITRSDIDQKTPYNTYQVDGLPPGPICNPGRLRHRGGAEAGRDRRPLLCRRWHWRPYVLRHIEGAQRGGGHLAKGGKGHPREAGPSRNAKREGWRRNPQSASRGAGGRDG